MKLLLKVIASFAIAFFLLIPTCYIIDTVFTEVGNAVDSYSQETDNINVSSEYGNNSAMFLNVYSIVYSVWGISFIITLLVTAFYSREEDYYG